MNVLIVEDDESVAKFLRQAVMEAGYSSQSVGNGTVALEMGRSAHFDLILLDVMLPGLDGFAVCRELRAAHISTPILLMTARDAVEPRA